MIIYVILIASAMNFVWKSGVIEEKFVVTQAVEQWVNNRRFDLKTTPQSFADIDDIDDIKDWLRYALPVIIASPVQQANFPLAGVRFSLRNVLDSNNTEPRFQALAKVTWKDKAGIRTSTSSSASSFTGGYDNDDTTSFGAYREYGFNSDSAQRIIGDHNATAQELSTFTLGLQWCSAPTTTCGGELLGDYFYDRSKSSADVVAKCNSKCEQMQQQNRLCHCWTLTTTHCDFYHMPLDLLVNTVPVDSADEPCWNHSAAVNVYPTLVQNTNGRTSYFPLMKRFVHTTNRPAGSTTFFANAYGSTQGFLQGVHYWTQEQVDDFVRWQSGTNSSLGAPSSQGLMFQQLNDWILGGFLGRTTGYLVVDWMNWNPNHDVVSWMVLKFKVDASGLVSSGRSVNHLVIPQSDLDQVREDPNSIFWPGFNVWHGLYILLVAYYFCKEVYELFTSGLRYFTGWQLLVDVGLLLHIAVIGLRYYHHSVASNFTKELAKDSADALVLDIATFEAEAVAWSNFLLASCFMMVFLFAGLVQYLSDLVPRISVLVDTVSRSITPVFFLVIILCDVFFAFVIWCNLLFGKTVRDFSNIQVTAISLTEMLFGRLDVVESLRIYFPITGFFFYLFFMVLFFFILQYLSRAIVLTSFDDATRSFEERQRTKKLLGDQLASFFKLQVAWAKKSLGLNFRAKDLKTAGGLEPYPTHKWGVVPFTFFCGIYVIFVSMALWVPEGHDVVLSLTEALKRPTFAKVNPLSREIDSELHFDQIETREDVLRWLAVSFSKTLYNSSSSDNVLGSYAPSPEYKQVVINDWNILLGQTPVRLSLNYDTMVPVSNNSVTARLPVAHLIRTEEPVTNVEDLKDPLAQDLLQQYCGNYTTEMGFSCMLSVDPSVTIPTLLDMRLKGITTNQTSAMTLDFVAYNGIIDMFFYVKINFDFTTSGYIDKDIKIYPIKLPDLTSSFFPIRLILEIFIIAFTVGRLAKCMRAVYRVALAGIKKGKAGAFGHRLMVVLQVLLFHILQHPFIIFDFLSGISTLVTLVMWYSFVLLDLTQTFYFAESPAWTPAQCADTGLCSDFTAISKFSQASQQMRFFTQICAANTVFLFLCYLKYLSAFRTGRVIARAMLNGTADLLCFFVVMVVLLMGYVCMGHTIFGTIMVDFSSLGYAVITCFQMFLGTFRSFAAMRQANSIAYYFYWYTYMVLFRYVMANMFFAIVAKHFQKEDQALEEKLGQEQAAEKGTFMDNLKGDMKLALKNVLGMVKPSKDPNEKLEEDNDGIESVAGEDLDPVSTPKSPRHSSTFAGREIETSPTEVDESLISSENVSEPNWRFLPDETRQWAVDTAKEIYRFIHEKSRLREEVEKHNKEQFDIDHVQEEAETAIQEKAFDLGKKAEKVKLDLSTRELRSLKAVHRDQESLAWYIMKRETELKKLEEAKSVKMDRYEKMVNATQLLVASDESQEPGPSSKSLTAGDPGQ